MVFGSKICSRLPSTIAFVALLLSGKIRAFSSPYWMGGKSKTKKRKGMYEKSFNESIWFWQENIQLSNWVSTQRQEYKLLQKGRSSRLNNERMDLLNKVE